MRYFPENYKRVKPVHLITDRFLPLKCKACGKELIRSLNYEHYKALIGVVTIFEKNHQEIIDVYWACKGECDIKLEKYYLDKDNAITGWEDISDLLIPRMFARWILTTMNHLHDATRQYKYTDEAFEQTKYFILAMCQKVFREMTEDEIKRAVDIFDLPDF